MAAPVKAARGYTSPRREEQAATTRNAILTAARLLFERDGYVATSIPAVATDARVAVKTVYVAFGSKVELLRAVWEARLAGEEAAVPVSERAWFRAVAEDGAPSGKIRLVACQSAGVKERSGRLLIMIRDAATTDPDIGDLWAEIEAKLLAVSRSVVDQIADLGALRAGVDPVSATDELWTLNHPSTWQLLVLQRGWSTDRYADWLEASFRSVLLDAGRDGDR